MAMDLSLELARKLKLQTDQYGSTLFSLTWKEHTTPAGRLLFRLAASVPRTEDSVCIGWGTPTVQDARHASLSPSEMERDPNNLRNQVHFAGWPTTRAEDAELSGMRHARGVADTMTAVASLAGGNTADIGKHQDGTKAQIGLENEAKLSGWTTPKKADGEQGSSMMMRGNLTLQGEARMGAWPTPMAGTPAQNGNNEAGNNDSSRKTVEMCQWPAVPSTDSGGNPIGYLLGPNGWEIVPACGQLNASHSRWLMGLPAVWDTAGMAAFRSLKKRRRA